ncbi:MAG: hypothetical protein ACTHNP_13285 [Solirubrobacterales bacterium]
MTKIEKLKICQDEVSPWLKKSLQQGFGLSDAVTAMHALDHGSSFALVPEEFTRKPLALAVGGVVSQKAAREGLVDFLVQLRDEGAKCVLIEDDLAGRMDPVVRRSAEPLAFLDDRVIHWCDLTDNVDEAARTTAEGASGYPLNGFVTTRSSLELGLADRQQVPAELPTQVAESLVAVICSAFDAESFVVWDIRSSS